MNMTELQEMQPVSGVLSQTVNFEGLLDRDNKARVIDVMVDKFAAAPDVEALYTKGGNHRGRPATPPLLPCSRYGCMDGLTASKLLAHLLLR